MKQYTIYCSWTMTGHHFINAESEEEARKKANDLPNDLPIPDGDYLNESLIIDDIDY